MSIYDVVMGAGGSYRAFDQKTYIAVKGWGPTNKTNAMGGVDRGGALTDGEGLGHGVCLGLSIVWISCKGDFDALINKIHAPDGMAAVRGIMNFQSQWFKNKVSGVAPILDLLKINGCRCTQAATGTFDGSSRGRDFIEGHAGRYLYCFYGGFGGHAIAFENSGALMKIFDPNCGQLVMPKAGFKDVTLKLLKGYQKRGELTGWFSIACDL